ncbi:MAG: UTP--glucose-1-phosphate uridylyltransferase [Verrucomicrobiota bacterium]
MSEPMTTAQQESILIPLIVADDPETRNTPLGKICRELSEHELRKECAALDAFWRASENLYERVRALFFLYAIHRFYLPAALSSKAPGLLSFEAFEKFLERRFAQSIEILLEEERNSGLSDTLCSSFAQTYYQLGLQNLADQVRRSVRTLRGNQWMFRTGQAHEHPLRIRKELLEPNDSGTFPVIHEKTAVRMDLSHSSWSDIFFLGMDYPEGARVLNISVDLAVRGRDETPRPPVEACFRVIDRPVIRLVSVDLEASAEIMDLADVFHFAKDYLGLLKGALIAAGVVPIAMEGSRQELGDLLERLVGPGRGIELVSCVNSIPKGSRLAVSTNLLGGLIAVCMRATNQARSLSGPLEESERRIVAARAILGEWLGGSGGGWQDSGGVWPGIKVIKGCAAGKEDPEFGISRGRLLPQHSLIGNDLVNGETRQKLQDSLVLVHGGMAQNVGPILEMVTEKYLLRSENEWQGRRESIALFEQIVDALKAGDIRLLAELTTQHFFGPLQTIIPWATTYFTERIIDSAQEEFGDKFWGFLMLGGMSGGGMGFFFDPSVKEKASDRVLAIMLEQKRQLQKALPFAMDPVVYDFLVNENGSASKLKRGDEAMMPPGYYAMVMPELIKRDSRTLSAGMKAEMDLFARRRKAGKEFKGTTSKLLSNLFSSNGELRESEAGLDDLLDLHGFDPLQHQQIREDMQQGLLGLSKNRLSLSSQIEDVRPGDVATRENDVTEDDIANGKAALANGEVAVVTLAAGAASRWTEGAGVVKALHPFCKFAERHRSFLEVHLGKTRRIGRASGAWPAHLITTSYMTHEPIADFLEVRDGLGYEGSLRLSLGRSIGLRMIPMKRDLRFLWEEMPQQVLDERAQKMRESVRSALISWAKSEGEGRDYRDNLPLQCLHPVGHWFEVPNLLLNGTLAGLLAESPYLRTLMLHNIDTLGADLDAGLLGLHRRNGDCITYEVITRRLEDRGGGLARINGQTRLIEGLAMPRESDEFKLSFYNTLTSWIDLDRMLANFGLTRSDLGDMEKVSRAVREFGVKLPTYITIKEVKKRWGHGQEDVFPVAQFEKLWGDMTAVPGVNCGFVVVPRSRGQQLKEQAQLDGWLRDGSKAVVESLCDFG